MTFNVFEVTRGSPSRSRHPLHCPILLLMRVFGYPVQMRAGMRARRVAVCQSGQPGPASRLTAVVTYDDIPGWYETHDRYRGSGPPGRTSKPFKATRAGWAERAQE